MFVKCRTERTMSKALMEPCTCSSKTSHPRRISFHGTFSRRMLVISCSVTSRNRSAANVLGCGLHCITGGRSLTTTWSVALLPKCIQRASPSTRAPTPLEVPNASEVCERYVVGNVVQIYEVRWSSGFKHSGWCMLGAPWVAWFLATAGLPVGGRLIGKGCRTNVGNFLTRCKASHHREPGDPPSIRSAIGSTVPEAAFHAPPMHFARRAVCGEIP